MRESTTYMYILEEGQIEQARKTLLRLGRIRFGQPSEATQMLIQGITDLGRLDHLTEAILQVNSWEELLSTT